MMKKKDCNIYIGEECDGFSIDIQDDKGLTIPNGRFFFSQESDHKGLKELFEMLGYETTYEEIY